MSKLSHYSGCYFPTVWMDHNCNLKFAVGIIFCYFWETFDSESNKHPSSVHHCCQGLRDERLNFCMRLSFYSRKPYVPTWRRTYSDRNSWLFCFKKYTKRIPTSQEILPRSCGFMDLKKPVDDRTELKIPKFRCFGNFGLVRFGLVRLEKTEPKQISEFRSKKYTNYTVG